MAKIARIEKYDGSQAELSQKVVSNPRMLPYSAISSQVKHLQGKVLTVIDASMSNTDQRKAVKDLVNNAFSSQLSWIYELCGYPDAIETEVGYADTRQSEK